MPEYQPSPLDESVHRYDADLKRVGRRRNRMVALFVGILVAVVIVWIVVSPLVSTGSRGKDRCAEAVGAPVASVSVRWEWFPPSVRCGFQSPEGERVKHLSPWPFG